MAKELITPDPQMYAVHGCTIVTYYFYEVLGRRMCLIVWRPNPMTELLNCQNSCVRIISLHCRYYFAHNAGNSLVLLL